MYNAAAAPDDDDDVDIDDNTANNIYLITPLQEGATQRWCAVIAPYNV